MKFLRNSLGFALLLGIGLVLAPESSAGAPLITANGTTCTLANAILTSNTNVNTGGCVRVGPNSINDTIELTYDVTLTTIDPTAGEEEDEEHGPTGLPEIEGHILLNGHGHTIQRDPELFSPAQNGDGADPCSGDGEKFRVMHVGYPGGNLTMNDATIKNGCSVEWGGGGFLFEGHDLVLDRVVITNNKALMGGGILAHESTTILTDSILSGNSALAGGGLYARTGTVKFINSWLTGNSATGGPAEVCVESLYIESCLPGGSGGAIALNGGTTSVLDSTIKNNTALSGGAFYNSGATGILTRAALSQNTATNGGVLFNHHGAVSMTNVSVFQNSATNGGVIYNIGTGQTRVVHGTLVQNSATAGGGVWMSNKKLVTISNTLLQNPAGGNCAAGAPGASVNSKGYNRSTDATCGLTLATDQQNVADLKLGSLTDDGTPAGAYYPLLAGSPAIDTGTADTTTTDQLGQLRMGLPDIGAIEYPRFVKVWLGGKTSADKNLRVDLLAEVFVDGFPAGPAQLPAVLIGGIGFANATLYTVPVPAVNAPSNSTLDLKISARRPCSASGPTSGTVRLWYNGQPLDTAPGQDAGSRLGATAANETTLFFLREGLNLSTTAGPGGASNQFVEIPVNSALPCTGPGRPFTAFGTWSVPII